MDLTGGNIGRLMLSNGSVVIPELHKRGTVGTIAGTVTGPTNELLAVIDKPRLGYPSRYGIKPAEAGGTSNVKFTFAIPMLKDLNADNVGIDVDGDFKDVKLPVNEQLRLTGGVFNVKLTGKGMKAHGAVQVNTAPMGFTWTEDFTGTAPIGTRIDVTSTLNSAGGGTRVSAWTATSRAKPRSLRRSRAAAVSFRRPQSMPTSRARVWPRLSLDGPSPRMRTQASKPISCFEPTKRSRLPISMRPVPV